MRSEWSLKKIFVRQKKKGGGFLTPAFLFAGVIFVRSVFPPTASEKIGRKMLGIFSFSLWRGKMFRTLLFLSATFICFFKMTPTYSSFSHLAPCPILESFLFPVCFPIPKKSQKQSFVSSSTHTHCIAVIVAFSSIECYISCCPNYY